MAEFGDGNEQQLVFAGSGNQRKRCRSILDPLAFRCDEMM